MPTVFSLFANPRAAMAALSPDIQALKASCGIDVQGAGKIPFICIDLTGGANMVGSNVLIGGPGGQLDFLSTAGYGKLGLPGDMLPSMNNPVTNTSFTDTRLGLAFHSDSAFLRGILDRVAPATAASINGAVIAARSENDTGNNPHNPMYAIHRAGADGSLATLIGSRASDSGGNSMAPVGLIDLSVRPTKIDRASDVTGLVDTGQLANLLSLDDTVAVMEAIQRISHRKMQVSDPKQPWADPKRPTVSRNEVVRELVSCGYVKAADVVDQFGNPASLNPDLDPDIVGAAGVFSRAEYDGDAEFRKTAAVMKMVSFRVCRRRHDRARRLRLPRPGPLHRRSARPARGPLHGRLSRVRRTPRPAAHAVCFLGRLDLGQRPGRQYGRRPWQVHVDQR